MPPTRAQVRHAYQVYNANKTRSNWRAYEDAVKSYRAGLRVVPGVPDPKFTYGNINAWSLPRPAANAVAPASGGLGGFDINKAIAQARQFTDAIKLGKEPTQEDIMSRYDVMSKLPGMSTEIYDKMLKNAEDSARLNMGFAMMKAGFGAAAAPREKGESTFSALSRTLFQPLSAAAMQTMGAARKEKMAAQLGKLGAQRGLSTAALQAEMSAKGIKDKAVMDLVMAAFKKTEKETDKLAKDLQINKGTEEDPNWQGFSGSVIRKRGVSKVINNAPISLTDDIRIGSGTSLTFGLKHRQIRIKPPAAGKASKYETSDKKSAWITPKSKAFLESVGVPWSDDLVGREVSVSTYQPKGDFPDLERYTTFTLGGKTYDTRKPAPGQDIEGRDPNNLLGDAFTYTDPKADKDKDQIASRGWYKLNNGTIVPGERLKQDNKWGLYEPSSGMKLILTGPDKNAEAVPAPAADKDKTTYTGNFVLIDSATNTEFRDPGTGDRVTARLDSNNNFVLHGTQHKFQPPLGTTFIPFSDFYKAKTKEPDPKGIRSKEFLEGDYLSGAGDLAGVWTSLERFRPEGKERGTLGVNAEAAIRGDFPFTMPDGSPIQEDLRKPIWDAYKGLIWRRTRGAKNVEFGPIIKKANEDFLKRSIYNMGMEPPRGPGVEPRPRPRVTNFKMAQEAMEAAKTPGADVKALFGNVDVTALDSKDLTSSSGKMVVAVNSAPDLFGEKTVGDTDDIQGRADREKAARTQFLDTGQSTAKWFNDLGISSDKVTSDRRKQFSGQSADQALELLQDSTRMLKEVRSFQNAMLATKGAVGWLKGNALDALLSTIGTEWLDKNDDYANLKVEGDRHQSGLSRKTGREWGDTRISNFDAEDYKLMNAAMGKSVTLNKSLLDKYERKLLDNIRTAMKQIGVANFDKVTIEDAIKAGADISGITPKNNFYSPYFKNKFALSNQPMPRHSDEYIQGLRKEGELERKLYKGSYLVPVIDASGALIPGKAPDKITAEDLEALRNTNPPLYKKKRELINFLWNQSYGKLK